MLIFSYQYVDLNDITIRISCRYTHKFMKYRCKIYREPSAYAVFSLAHYVEFECLDMRPGRASSGGYFVFVFLKYGWGTLNPLGSKISPRC